MSWGRPTPWAGSTAYARPTTSTASPRWRRWPPSRTAPISSARAPWSWRSGRASLRSSPGAAVPRRPRKRTFSCPRSGDSHGRSPRHCSKRESWCGTAPPWAFRGTSGSLSDDPKTIRGFSRSSTRLWQAADAKRTAGLGILCLLEHPDPLREGDEKLVGQVGHVAQQDLKVLPVYDEHPQRSGRAHGDRARAAIEQAHLPEEVAGLEEVPLLARLLDRGGAVDEHEELVARLSGPRQRGPRRHLDHARDVGDRAELLLAAVGEERHLLEMGHLLVVAHAGSGGLGPAER